MPAIVEDQEFPSLLAFKDALRDWAIEQNFTPHILDSDKQRVRAGCRSAPNCQFRIRVNFNAKQGIARVTTCEPDHCHPLGDGVSQNIKRPESAKLKFLLNAVPQLLHVNINTTTRQICTAVEKKYGQQISARQAQKVKRVLVKKPCMHCNVYGHSSKHCPIRPASAETEIGDGGNDATDEGSSGTERPRRKSRCLGCFQTGHNRKNCPERPRPSVGTIVQDPSMIAQNQLQQAAYAPAQPPINVVDDTFNPPIEDDAATPSATVQPQDQATSQAPTTKTSTTVAPLNIRPSMYNSMVPPTSQPGPSFVTFADDVETHTVHLRPPQDHSVSQPQQPQVPSVSQPRPTQDPRISQPRPPPPPLPQDPKLRAAELMRQAAGLTQEAARLNYEAARLIASAPG